MAYGLPVEGDDGPFLGDDVETVPTCNATATVADARRVLAGSGADTVVLVHGDGLAVGEVDDEALAGHADDVALLDVLSPVPSTVRPSVTAASLAEAGGGERLVTTSDGRLLGVASVEPAGHEGHDHAGHDHEGHDHEGHDEPDDEHYDQELAAVLAAIGDRFGDREPTAEELRSFLHDRLVAEGRSAEEADRYLEELEAGDAG